MNQSLWLGVTLGAALATAGGALATSGFFKATPDSAEVLTVKPIQKSVQVPFEQCQEVQVPSAPMQAQVQDEHQMMGMALGALAGGLLGSQLGEGDGQRLSTLAGAVAGGYAGRHVQQQMQVQAQQAQSQQTPSYATTTETHCTSALKSEMQVTGYEVRYIQDGQLKQVQTDYDPGRRISLAQGQPIVSQAQLPAQGPQAAVASK